jgi:hypothetical protein
MPELKKDELEQLRSELRELVADLDQTFQRLPEDVRDFYRAAEQSVIDARRKVETHEGLYQVN